MHIRNRFTELGLVGLTCAVCVSSVGCNSIKNGWLDPTVLGSFERKGTSEIRTSLTLEDTPTGIPGATYPTQADLVPQARELPFSGGDEIGIEINELRQRQVPFQSRVSVSPVGDINLPIVGTVHAEGFEPLELQEEIKRVLREKDILRDPDVTVTPLLIHKNTYSLFGIGVSASDNSPLRAGTFPISRPDLRVLEAINRVGGLNEFVTDVYLFRYEDTQALPEHKHEEEKANEPQDKNEDAVASAMRDKNLRARADTQRGVHVAKAGVPVLGSPVKGPEDLLLSAIAQEEQGSRKADDDEAADIEALLRPEPTQPYIYVDGQWKPNPEFQESKPALEEQLIQTGRETITPAVNWARIAGESTYRIVHVPADPLRDGDPSVNVVIRPGDVIRIVSGEIGVYYMMGQINRIGPFNFNAEKITLKSAIAAAGGLSGLAWPDRCTVYRRIGQREQMIQVNIDRIFAGLDEDFIIKRGDIINVGTHPFAPFLQQIRNFTIPNVVNNVGYSFTYARNFADIDSFSVQANPQNEVERFPNLFP